MKFKKAVIDAGLMKTATTARQKHFAANRLSLLEHGWLYPKHVSHNHSAPLCCIFRAEPEKYHFNVKAGITTKDAADKRAAEFRDTFERQFRETDADNILISAEAMQNLPADELSAIKDWLLQYAYEVVAVVAVRNPISWTISAAQEQIRQGKTLAAIAAKPPMQAAKSRLEKLSATFPLKVVAFDNAIQDEGGILGAICDAAGVPTAWSRHQEMARSYESMSMPSALFMSALNEIRPLYENGKIAPNRHWGDLKVFENMAGEPFTIPSSAMPNKLFSKEAAWLNEMYGLRVTFQDRPEHWPHSERDYDLAKSAVAAISDNLSAEKAA